MNPFKLKPEYANDKDANGLVRACRWAFYHGDTHSGFQMCKTLDQLVFSSDPFAATPDDMMDYEKSSWERSARACRGTKQELQEFFEDEDAAFQAMQKISMFTSREERGNASIPAAIIHPADRPQEMAPSKAFSDSVQRNASNINHSSAPTMRPGR